MYRSRLAFGFFSVVVKKRVHNGFELWTLSFLHKGFDKGIIDEYNTMI